MTIEFQGRLDIDDTKYENTNNEESANPFREQIRRFHRYFGY